MSALELKIRSKEIYVFFIKREKKRFNSKEKRGKKIHGNEMNTVDKALLNYMVWNLLGEHFINFVCVQNQGRVIDEWCEPW